MSALPPGAVRPAMPMPSQPQPPAGGSIPFENANANAQAMQAMVARLGPMMAQAGGAVAQAAQPDPYAHALAHLMAAARSVPGGLQSLLSHFHLMREAFSGKQSSRGRSNSGE